MSISNARLYLKLSYIDIKLYGMIILRYILGLSADTIVRRRDGYRSWKPVRLSRARFCRAVRADCGRDSPRLPPTMLARDRPIRYVALQVISRLPIQLCDGGRKRWYGTRNRRARRRAGRRRAHRSV